MRIKGFIFDYGGTLDTRGNHWGKVLWHGYERTGVPVGEQDSEMPTYTASARLPPVR